MFRLRARPSPLRYSVEAVSGTADTRGLGTLATGVALMVLTILSTNVSFGTHIPLLAFGAHIPLGTLFRGSPPRFQAVPVVDVELFTGLTAVRSARMQAGASD